VCTPSGPHELTIIAVPPGLAGEQFRALTAAAVSAAEFTPAPLPDDICFYREYPQLRMAELPTLGQFRQEGYQALAPARQHTTTQACPRVRYLPLSVPPPRVSRSPLPRRSGLRAEPPGGFTLVLADRHTPLQEPSNTAGINPTRSEEITFDRSLRTQPLPRQ